LPRGLTLPRDSEFLFDSPQYAELVERHANSWMC
jgi:hypothetical protein